MANVTQPRYGQAQVSVAPQPCGDICIVQKYRKSPGLARENQSLPNQPAEQTGTASSPAPCPVPARRRTPAAARVGPGWLRSPALPSASQGAWEITTLEEGNENEKIFVSSPRNPGSGAHKKSSCPVSPAELQQRRAAPCPTLINVSLRFWTTDGRFLAVYETILPTARLCSPLVLAESRTMCIQGGKPSALVIPTRGCSALPSRPAAMGRRGWVEGHAAR